MKTLEALLNSFTPQVSTAGNPTNNDSLKLYAYPEKYSPLMSSTPGIRIFAEYGGVADRIRYSTINGGLLEWDTETSKTSEHGHKVELPISTPVYWSALLMGDSTTKITVKAEVFNGKSKVAEKLINIKPDGAMHFVVEASPDVIIAEEAEALAATSLTTDGWTIDYPVSWDKAGDGFIQDEETGKTIDYSSQECSKDELEKWIDLEIKRKLAATEASNTLQQPLSKAKKGRLWVYSYMIESKMEGHGVTQLKTTVFFDGKKRYEFRGAIPPLTEQEFDAVTGSFRLAGGADASAVEEDVKEYITNFLKKGFSKHYIIDRISFDFRDEKIENGRLEAIVFTTMNSHLPPKDPDTVPYIIAAKKKAQTETNPEKKKILQSEYETLKNEYGKPNDSNFVFKLTAKMAGADTGYKGTGYKSTDYSSTDYSSTDYKIDKSSVKLYLEQDVSGGMVRYVAAERVLPGR